MEYCSHRVDYLNIVFLRKTTHKLFPPNQQILSNLSVRSYRRVQFSATAILKVFLMREVECSVLYCPGPGILVGFPCGLNLAGALDMTLVLPVPLTDGFLLVS
mmetsp:Transcript_28464/g.37213  ORF Transcript_28464/g.37213 Transcript_28464/m.37213 type:complete len:103 (-) Transcript_28464:1759-2067(-)